MQEAAFESCKIKAFYLALELSPSHFRKVMRSLSTRIALQGFNVTVPYKEAVIPFLDGLTKEARLIGAVNTVFRKGNRWLGANTDASGFLDSLKVDARFHPQGKNILVLGAGGSARAVVYALASRGARQIQIANRHPLRAGKMVRDFKSHFRLTRFQALHLDRDPLKKAVSEADLIVNATSVGLHPKDGSLLPPSLVRRRKRGVRKAVFYDLIYRPSKTAFLQLAKSRGHQAVNGLGMLAAQGARSFEVWTGKNAPLSVMRKVLTQTLKGKTS